MNGTKEKHLGELVDECDVCKKTFEDLSKAFTTEYGGLVLTFCSEACFKQYLEDPEMYSEFGDEDPLE